MRPELQRVAVVAIMLTAAPLPAAAGTISVTIDNLQYAPAQVRARVGDTLTWINKDMVAHTATARAGGFDVTIPAGKSAGVKLRRPGRIDYYCRFHPNMTASVTVEGRAGDAGDRN